MVVVGNKVLTVEKFEATWCIGLAGGAEAVLGVPANSAPLRSGVVSSIPANPKLFRSLFHLPFLPSFCRSVL